MAAVSLLVEDVAIESKHVIETNLVRPSYHFALLHIYSHFKQLCISNKIEQFSFSGGCGCRMHIKAFKEELAWGSYR